MLCAAAGGEFVGVTDVVVVVFDTQPVVDERTNAPINSNGSAYFNGILMYRFIIRAIGFIMLPRTKE